MCISFFWAVKQCRMSYPMAPLCKIGSPSSPFPVTWKSCWRKTSIGWWMTSVAHLWPACALFPFVYLLAMTGTTSTLTCLAKIWLWLCNSSYVTWGTTLAHWRAMWCARFSWTHHCGSPWLISSGRPWKWSWWRNTRSSV